MTEQVRPHSGGSMEHGLAYLVEKIWNGAGWEVGLAALAVALVIIIAAKGK